MSGYGYVCHPANSHHRQLSMNERLRQFLRALYPPALLCALPTPEPFIYEKEHELPGYA